jgi:hypothetical protein
MTRIEHDKMQVGDLLEYRCPNFGILWQWRILGIYLGATKQEGLIEVATVMQRAGTDGQGRTYDLMMVPEPMTRTLDVIRP